MTGRAVGADSNMGIYQDDKLKGKSYFSNAAAAWEIFLVYKQLWCQSLKTEKAHPGKISQALVSLSKPPVRAICLFVTENESDAHAAKIIA